MNQKRTRMILVGCGSMARTHLENILKQPDTTRVTAICDPSPEQIALAKPIFEKYSAKWPHTGAELEPMLKEQRGELDAAFIVTPHVYHLAQATACLESGLDVLLEKPMVMNAKEARKLIRTRNATNKLLVVAFPGSLSPQIREAVRMLRAGELGELLSISGIVWQNWKTSTARTWRQVPSIAGGGFLFDTGAHLLNTTADLAGEEFTQVAAWLDNRGAPVDILGVVMAKLKSGAYVTLQGCGDSFPTWASEILVIGSGGLLRTGVWGERLEMQKANPKRARQLQLRRVPLPPSLGVWEQFLDVRAGKMENPCPPEVGLRMAKLWDAICESARADGKPVTLN